ncbi:Histone ubiquitination proteins group [Hibiscus syriacus]|uniref:Histone ubiquitination proteins group n=1 Tax=Hibiscus syriacus TaxID=106335 RepID=A0A6A2ZZS5_HIBSY|nr:Histone ubiquitination proteins group [Hibiscus syriacus]
MREAERCINGVSRTGSVAETDGLGNDGVMSQLFTSLPALNEAAGYLAQTTNYLADCFYSYSEEPAFRDSRDYIVRLQLATASSGQTENPVISDQPFSSGSSSTLSTSSCYATTVSANHHSAGVSAGDPSEINGWLKRDPEMPSIEDGTVRITEILEDISQVCTNCQTRWSIYWFQVKDLQSADHICRHMQQKRSFQQPWASLFCQYKTSFSKMGLTCHIAKIHCEASVEKNAGEIKDYIEEIYWGSGKRVLLLGHSKGGVDAAAALSIYWPDLKDKVAGYHHVVGEKREDRGTEQVSNEHELGMEEEQGLGIMEGNLGIGMKEEIEARGEMGFKLPATANK